MKDPRNLRQQTPTHTLLGATARLRAKLQRLRGAENRRRVVAKIGLSATPRA